ncbi:MAG: acetate--CoA ligase family protein [Deltaproteobacteria bacterium]|nr:acetate--CoA ligase family protein [Deltaproteobacteria bacterium]
MSPNPLHAIMNPSSIAVVGASNTITKMGAIQCLNLIKSGFTGEVMPVNPDEETVLGKKAYPSVLDLPHAPDIAVLVIPSRLVPEILEKFGKIGTRFAVVVTAGFKETGDAGRAREKEIVSIARRFGMRFIGPNCLGILNTHLPFNITVMPTRMSKGSLGLVSQSGTYVAQTLPYLSGRGVRLSKAISVGNEADIDIVDCLEYLGEDDDTRAIGLYIEGIRRAGRFLEVAREITKTKPVVAQYVGGTEAGARSGSSHTGAMAGPDYVYDGLFEQAGVIRVDTIEEVYTIGWALAAQPALKGPRIAVLTNSGGPGTAIANTLNRGGLDVPVFSEDVQKEVSRYLPGSHASAKNPVDLTFHVGMDAISEKIPQILFNSHDVDGIVLHGIMDTGLFTEVSPLVKDLFTFDEEEFIDMSKVNLDNLVNMPRRHGKPLLISSFFGNDDHATRTFRENGIPTFDSPEKAARAMNALYRHLLIRNRANGTPDGECPVPAEARNIIQNAKRGVLDEYRCKRVLDAYGISTTREVLVETADEAVEQARSIGFPVVLKACSTDIPHKTERGLVHLNLKSDEAVRRAYNAVKGAVPHSPILISEMVRGDREFMAGVSYHPGFPPCIMFGLGGVLTEALHDNTIRIAPLGTEDTRSMMESLAAKALLGAYRGMKPVDRESLSSLLIALGRLAIHFPEIGEIDLNPIIIADGKPKVVDALFILE